MKSKILLAFIFIPMLGWAQKSDVFTLNGKTGTGMTIAKVYLRYGIKGIAVTDSTTVQNGSYRFTGKLSSPTMAQLLFDYKGTGLTNVGNDPDVLTMYLESTNITVETADYVKNATVKGSKLNDENKKYQAQIASAEKVILSVNQVYQTAPPEKQGDQHFMDSLNVILSKYGEQEKVLQTDYIKQNPGSYLSLVLLMQTAQPPIDLAVIEPLYKMLSADVRDTYSGQEFAKQLDAVKATSVGAIAPDFTQNDVNDKPVKLSDFRGKYVLLDFWASWCGPCRAENPNVVSAYEKYKDKNFTVLGVSLDQPGKKENWLAAIKADGLTWTQVSDLKFWQNTAARQYNILSIPQNYLIDPSGKIIAANLRGEALDKQLASLFDH
jgi:peroxiredoxin